MSFIIERGPFHDLCKCCYANSFVAAFIWQYFPLVFLVRNAYNVRNNKPTVIYQLHNVNVM